MLMIRPHLINKYIDDAADGFSKHSMFVRILRCLLCPIIFCCLPLMPLFAFLSVPFVVCITICQSKKGENTNALDIEESQRFLKESDTKSDIPLEF